MSLILRGDGLKIAFCNTIVTAHVFSYLQTYCLKRLATTWNLIIIHRLLIQDIEVFTSRAFNYLKNLCFPSELSQFTIPILLKLRAFLHRQSAQWSVILF